MLLGGYAGLLADLHQIGSQRRGDAGEVEPVGTIKDGIPSEVGGLGLLNGGVRPIVDAHAAPLGGTLFQIVDADAVAAPDDRAVVDTRSLPGV